MPFGSIPAQFIHELLHIAQPKAQKAADGDVRKPGVSACGVIANPFGRYPKYPGYLIGCKEPLTLCT